VPFINGRFYMNPSFGRGVESARSSEVTPSDHDKEQSVGAHWITIEGRHVLIHEGMEHFAESATQSAPSQSRSLKRAPKTFSGEATYYTLPGRKTASGSEFDANKMAAAMTGEKVKLGQIVTVTYTYRDKQGKPMSRSIDVIVNDRGPFARDSNGKATHPLQPAPGRVIDLTPAAFTKLVGTTKPGHVPVTVTVPSD